MPLAWTVAVLPGGAIMFELRLNRFIINFKVFSCSPSAVLNYAVGDILVRRPSSLCPDSTVYQMAWGARMRTREGK